MLWGIGDTRRFTDPEACNETTGTDPTEVGAEHTDRAPPLERMSWAPVSLMTAAGGLLCWLGLGRFARRDIQSG